MYTLQKKTLNAAVALLYLIPSLAMTTEIVIENEAGESFVLHVGAGDTFEEVCRSIDKIALNSTFDRASSSKDLNMFIPSASGPITVQIARGVRPAPRSYEAGITQAQVADIAYILRTLANSSLAKIKTAESSLKKAGQRIDDIHPLHFLGCIFTNEELKVCARNIKGRSWVWKGFVNGSIDTLTEENAKNNVAPYLNDFADRVKVDVNLLIPLQAAGKWEKFVIALIDAVPREGNTDRYDH